jgi:hypothetical protein
MWPFQKGESEGSNCAFGKQRRISASHCEFPWGRVAITAEVQSTVNPPLKPSAEVSVSAVYGRKAGEETLIVGRLVNRVQQVLAFDTPSQPVDLCLFFF